MPLPRTEQKQADLHHPATRLATGLRGNLSAGQYRLAGSAQARRLPATGLTQENYRLVTPEQSLDAFNTLPQQAVSSGQDSLRHLQSSAAMSAGGPAVGSVAANGLQSHQDVMDALRLLNQLPESTRLAGLQAAVNQKMEEIRDENEKEKAAEITKILSQIESLSGAIDQHADICNNLNFQLYALFLKGLNVKYSNQIQELGRTTINDMYQQVRGEYNDVLSRYLHHNAKAFSLWMDRVRAKYKYGMMTLVCCPGENHT